MASIVLWIGVMIHEKYVAKKYRKDLTDGLMKELPRRIVVIEGRCPKCDERIPDELLTKEDLKKPSQAIN
jgi:hypothetical protein